MPYKMVSWFLSTGHVKKATQIYSISKRYLSSSIKISEEVQAALSSKAPVVALESTIITHGMPFPHNLSTAKKVEAIVRREGAVPATIAVMGGKIHVGLTHEQLLILSEKKEPCIKASRRDLPFVLAKGLNGGTTVSSTMLIAETAGIPIFVTGGIGGVHRGAASSMDISADLTELGKTPVTVVSAGVKSILDIKLTLEYLETQGVCVSVLGPTSRFPDFFTRDSGFEAPCHITSPREAALMMKHHKELELKSGILIAVPIPEKHEVEGQKIRQAIDVAVNEAEASVAGRDVTPYILQRVFELTGGESLQSNIALVENNAKIGSQIAVEYSDLLNGKMFFPSTAFSKKKNTESQSQKRRPVC
ncbi:pseudouridine-5'-phosphate glycosidase-like isoform X2 [Oratosquilla oratoria]|uniref:pseudouridine-5'-phosphate glycosidase-like isoform X2 n=1 Tax=Oratosquilla oratoria TaxID=337810 RepID=UPI003F7746C0